MQLDILWHLHVCRIMSSLAFKVKRNSKPKQSLVPVVQSETERFHIKQHCLRQLLEVGVLIKVYYFFLN